MIAFGVRFRFPYRRFVGRLLINLPFLGSAWAIGLWIGMQMAGTEVLNRSSLTVTGSLFLLFALWKSWREAKGLPWYR